MSEQRMAGPSEDNVCYDVKKWPRFLYDIEKEANKGLAQAEKSGQAAGWSNFVLERFAKFHNPRLQRLDPPAEGSDIVSRLHEQCEAMPEPKALEARTMGDEVLSGMAAATVCKTLSARMSEQMEKPRQEPKKLKQRVKGLEQIVKDNPGSKKLERKLEEAKANLQQVLQEQAEAAQGLDPVQLRAAIREACEKAQDEIEEFQDTINAYSYGSQPGTPTRHSAEEVRKLAARVRNHDKHKRIANLAGRLRREAAQKQKQKTDKVTSEISNIEIGNDLSRVLPSELASLADPAMELDFYRRYADKRLLQYKLTGKETKARGPIIFLADESGSQSGEPDIRTKATALAMLEVAQRQKRVWCYVHFEASVTRVDIAIPGKVSTGQLMECMEHFTGGGTNFRAPLDKAIELIKDHGSLKDADVIMITDGYCSTDEEWDRKFLAEKKQLGFSVFSVLVNMSSESWGTVEKWSDQVYRFDDLLQDKFKDRVYAI